VKKGRFARPRCAIWKVGKKMTIFSYQKHVFLGWKKNDNMTFEKWGKKMTICKFAFSFCKIFLGNKMTGCTKKSGKKWKWQYARYCHFFPHFQRHFFSPSHMYVVFSDFLNLGCGVGCSVVCVCVFNIWRVCVCVCVFVCALFVCPWCWRALWNSPFFSC